MAHWTFDLDSLSSHKRELIEWLWIGGAIKIYDILSVRTKNRSTFCAQLPPDAPLPTYDIDLSIVPHPVPDLVTSIFASMIGASRIPDNAILAGISQPGGRLATSLGRLLNRDRLSFERDKPGDGRRLIYAGPNGLIDNGCHLRPTILVNDMLGIADIELEAQRVLTSREFDVTDLLVLIDHQQGGEEQLARVNVRVRAALTITEIFGFLWARDKISETERDLCLAYPTILNHYRRKRPDS